MPLFEKKPELKKVGRRRHVKSLNPLGLQPRSRRIAYIACTHHLRFVIILEEIQDNRRSINRRIRNSPIRPLMTQIQYLIMTHNIINALTRIPNILISISSRQPLISSRILTAIAPSPPRKPLRDRRQRSTVPGTTIIADGLVDQAVDLKNGKRRPRGFAVAVMGVRVESAGYGCKSCEWGAVIW